MGDLVDCIDQEGSWYRSTVLQIEEEIISVQPVLDGDGESSISKPPP